jgi:plasmid maintenance system killer protein
VDIFIKNAKLVQMLNEEARFVRAFGARTARMIRLRLAVLAASPSLADVSVRPPERRHQLRGNPDHQFAVYAGPPCRIVFEPTSSAPRAAGGRLDLRRVNAIDILDIVDRT